MVPAVSSVRQTAWDGSFRAWDQLQRTVENSLSEFECVQHVGCQRGSWDPKRTLVPGAAIPGQKQKRCQQAPGPPSQLKPFPFPHGRSSLSPCFHPLSSKIWCYLHGFEARSQQCLPAVQKSWARGGDLGRWASRISVRGSSPAEMQQLLLGLLPDMQPIKAHDSSAIQLTLCPRRSYTSEFFQVSGKSEDLWAWRLVSGTFCGG